MGNRSDYYGRPRIYSEPLWKIYQLLEDKDDSFLWDLFYKIVDGEMKAGHIEDNGNEIFAKMQSNYVESLEDLIRVCKINLDEHIIIDHKVGTHQVPMKVRTKTGEDENNEPVYEDKPVKIQAYNVKAKLKRRVPEGGIEKAFDSFVEKAKDYAPEYSTVNTVRPKQGSRFGEISLYDLHVGKLAWAPETGENYDTKIALERFRDAFRECGDYCLANGCDEIVVPLGNDLIHIDNPEGNTTSGTPQDTDGRWQYMIDKTEEAFIEVLEDLAQKSKVHVMYVAGNHDEKFSYFITKYLSAWFRNHKNITVDKSPTLTKFYENGVNLIAYNHFKDIKPSAMPQYMATSVPEKWARCWYREAHGGHWHTRKTKGVKVDTFEQEEQGVLYRVLPSLCESDSWHVRKGYEGNIKAAQALLYDKQKGFCGLHQYNHIKD